MGFVSNMPDCDFRSDIGLHEIEIIKQYLHVFDIKNVLKELQIPISHDITIFSAVLICDLVFVPSVQKGGKTM